jgi:Transposase DDE domain
MKNLSVSDLLSLIPDSKLDFFVATTKVDWNVKKLGGKELFKLLLYSLVTEDKSSLRVFESAYEDLFFCQYAGIPPNKTVRFTSISDRIKCVELDYFKEIYLYCVERFGKEFNEPEKKRLCRFDSTFIKFSASLLKIGMHLGQKNKQGELKVKQIKFSIGFDGLLPFIVRTFADQSELAEDVSLGELVSNYSLSKNDVAIFDRGLKDRNRFKQLSKANKFFVTRIYNNSKFELLAPNQGKPLDFENEYIQLENDQLVYLFDRKSRKIDTPFRLIQGALKRKAGNQKIMFLTNMFDLTASEVAEIYKERWGIERFFRIIKQNLNFSHFFAYNLNGIQVMLYMMLIAAIILMVYIQKNQMKGFKIPKMKFCNELRDEILKHIIILCGGNPYKLETFKYP